MMKTGAYATGALVLALATGTAHAATNLVADGDFTSPSGGSVFVTYHAGSSFGPWNVLDGSIDLIGGYWQPPTPGTGSVDVNGLTDGSFDQSIATKAGSTYKLAFDLSGNPVGSPTTKVLQVSVGGVTQIFTYKIGANSRTDMMYTPESLTFTATGPTTLIFTSLDQERSFYGPVVGDVSITAVPEPASWALMLLGVAAMGGALRAGRSRETCSTTA